jgi:hypothetical protein
LSNNLTTAYANGMISVNIISLGPKLRFKIMIANALKNQITPVARNMFLKKVSGVLI